MNQEALRYCRWLTDRAGSHFALSFRLLPRERREGMEVVYAYCRAVDDAVDREGVSEEEARRDLQQWRLELEACGQGFPAHPIAVGLRRIRNRFEIPWEFFGTVIAGAEMDLRPRRFRTFQELRVYCEHVASAVGRISVRVFGCRHPASDRYADELGVAFQLTNILRDLRADLEIGRLYLPLEDLERFGCTEEGLHGGRADAAFGKLMEFECRRARDHFRSAEKACRESGERRRLLPARIMAAVYADILREIERAPGQVLRRRIAVPKRRQFLLAARCLIT